MREETENIGKKELIIRGIYAPEIGKHYACELLTSNGIINTINIPDLPPNIYHNVNQKVNTQYQLISLHSKSTFPPSESNYKIEFQNSKDEYVKIYLKLSEVDVFKIKWNLKKHLIQSKDFKIGLMLVIIGVLLTYALANDNPINILNTPIKKQTIKRDIETSSSSDLDLDSISNKDTNPNKTEPRKLTN